MIVGSNSRVGWSGHLLAIDDGILGLDWMTEPWECQSAISIPTSCLDLRSLVSVVLTQNNAVTNDASPLRELSNLDGR